MTYFVFRSSDKRQIYRGPCREVARRMIAIADVYGVDCEIIVVGVN